MDIRTKQNQIILIALLFIIPLNLYKIANNLGSGTQWALFSYQQTLYGNQVFTIPMNLGYVFSGLITGRSAVSLLFWSFGTIILIVALALLLFTWYKEKLNNSAWCSILVMISGTCYVVSCMAQYGPIFNGAAGFCIPLGIPIVWIVGFLMYDASKEHTELNGSEGALGENDNEKVNGKNFDTE